jgi:pimeloyl-ACP methyl ester carboxylesterase
MKTPRAESVIAADDMAFLGRLWEDWSPDYDVAEDLYHVKRCLREPGNLSAAIGVGKECDVDTAVGSRMDVIEDAGHFPHLERAAAVNERILAWVG